MAQITSAGIGSGLDVNSLVNQIVTSERKPVETRLNARETQLEAQMSAVGSFRSDLDALRTAAQALTGSGSFSARNATSSDEDLFTATATSAAATGSYDVEVLALAASHKLSSEAYVSAATLVGAGSLSITVGSNAFTVNTTGTTTLAQLRDAINNSTANTGVQAALVAADDGVHLMLTSRESGTVHTLTVSSAGLTAPLSNATMTEKRPPADAQVRLDGYLYTSSSNEVSGVLGGVTLRLKSADPGTTQTLDVVRDPEATRTGVKAFIDAYNKFMTDLAKSTKYDAATKTGGPLLGDALARDAGNTLRNIVGGSSDDIAGAFGALAQVGITTAQDGTLTLNPSAFDAALAGDPASVAALFGSATGGVATRIDALANDYLHTNGRLDAKTHSLQARLDDIASDRERLQTRLDRIEARYREQFSALDTLVSKMQSTSSFLTQQLAALNNNK